MEPVRERKGKQLCRQKQTEAKDSENSVGDSLLPEGGLREENTAIYSGGSPPAPDYLHVRRDRWKAHNLGLHCDEDG